MNPFVFRSLSYGLYVLTTMDEKRPVGCVVNCAMQITVEPDTIAVSINHDNYTQKCIDENGYFAISVLAEDVKPSIIGDFGFQSSKDVDKFKDVSHSFKNRMPILDDSVSYIICKVVNKMETSTHTVYLGEVVDGEYIDEKREPMTYKYYHAVLKGSSPKNAPTYIAEEFNDNENVINESTSSKWVCTVCGYVYDGDPLPEDYICPICKQGADKFKKI